MKRLKVSLLILLSLGLMGCTIDVTTSNSVDNRSVVQETVVSTVSVDETVSASVVSLDSEVFTGENAYEVINNNIPYFTESDYTVTSFENYAELDSLGRCGVAYACVGQDLMPDDTRESISSVKPTGWQSVKYDIVSGKYLYNRCHLIGYQLTAENANKQNLITGTRYLNIDGMLPFENMVTDYIKETNNHVLYRVTPVFEGDNLVASGVQMEGWSVEDNGEGICYNVYCYNAQPGIIIDYATGESWLAEDYDPSLVTKSTSDSLDNTDSLVSGNYILNTKSKKFHLPSCSEVKRLKDENKEASNKSKEELVADGYTACGKCNP
jgi:DNA-entry nuclease